MPSEDGRSPEAAEIERQVLDFLQRELLAPGTAVGRDADLLSGEVLDSMGVLRLAAFVGEAFRIDIRPSDFLVENFRTVAIIAGYGRRTLAGRAPEGSSP
jgi:acyl carrier protein